MSVDGACSMNICFRTDASLVIGSGHVMRCLALASALRESGSRCHFVCSAHPGHLGAKIEAEGHRLTLLAATPNSGQFEERKPPHASWLGGDHDEDARHTIAALEGARPDWLIVDHYALDAAWETLLRPQVNRLMAMDDLADRSHKADLLLDQNLGRAAKDYDGLVPPDCVRLIGPSYALLRPEFAAARASSLSRRRVPRLRNIAIGMGGVDARNVTGRVLQALQTTELPRDCALTVLMGTHAPWLESVREQARRSRWPCEVHVNSANVAQIMANSDLAIGAAGGTTWERCCLGLPTILCVLADNQRNNADHVTAVGAAILMTDASELPALFASRIDERALLHMAEAATRLCDGNGCARVRDALLRSDDANAGHFRVRPMLEDDLDEVLRWRNHPEVRRYMFTRHEITPAEHRAWFERSRRDSTNHLLVFEIDGRASGFVRFKQMEWEAAAEWGFYVRPGAPAGTGRKLGSAALAYAFDTLGFRELHGRALVTNQRSIAFHRRLGFAEHDMPGERGGVGEDGESTIGFRLRASEWSRETRDR